MLQKDDSVVQCNVSNIVLPDDCTFCKKNKASYPFRLRYTSQFKFTCMDCISLAMGHYIDYHPSNPYTMQWITMEIDEFIKFCEDERMEYFKQRKIPFNKVKTDNKHNEIKMDNAYCGVI